MLIISIRHCFYPIKECNQFRIYLTIFSETFNILGYLLIMSKNSENTENILNRGDTRLNT